MITEPENDGLIGGGAVCVRSDFWSICGDRVVVAVFPGEGAWVVGGTSLVCGMLAAVLRDDFCLGMGRRW